MGRKRRRPAAEVATAAVASAAPPAPPPPPPPPYFRYTPAQEKTERTNSSSGGADDNIDNSRYSAPSLRGRHQREVDKVDTPAPAEWLCHDAAASARLLAQAQTDLQLFQPRRPSHQPHSERQQLRVRNRDAGLVAAIKSTVGNKNGFHGTKRELRPGRVVCGGEVLPWGTWPTRLRHHDGQSFYQEDWDAGTLGASGGVHGGAPRYVVGGGGVGRSGGVGIVSEGSIHDDLLRRQLPPSFPSSSSLFSSTYQHHEETAVTRLVPDKRGRWAEANTRRAPTTAAAAAVAAAAAAAAAVAALPGNNLAAAPAGLDISSSRPSSPPATPTAAPTSTTAAVGAGDAVKCMVPGRYGGWVEFEETVNERAQNNAWQRQKRRAAVSMAAKFGPDSSGSGGGAGMTGVVPDAALPSSYLDEEKYARQMVAEAATAAAAAVATTTPIPTPTREAQRQQREELTQNHQQGTYVGTTMEESHEDGGEIGVVGVAKGGAEGMETDRGCGNVAGAGGFGKRRADDCRGQGWAVSEPAKETVRRVWNRARRRARDSFEPRYATPQAGDGDLENEASAAAAAAAAALVEGNATAAAGSGGIRDNLDPALLHCLGRECEGIVDAALHVVLGDRLRAVQTSSVPVSSPTEQEKHNSTPPLPPPLATADWQDVLRAMQNCSNRARGIRTPPMAAVAAASAKSDDNGKYPSSRAAVERGGSHGGKHRGGGAAGGGEGVPGRGVMERAVWGAGGSSDGSVVVVNERLPGLPLNEAVLTRAYNRLLLYLHEKKTWHA